MHRTLYIVIILLFFFSCKDKEINFAAASCYPQIKDIKRGKHVVDFPVTVQLSGGLVAGGRLMVSKDNAWSACNLPEVFLQDSLALYVSGYLLTSPSLEVMNLVPVPFEVTSAKLR